MDAIGYPGRQFECVAADPGPPFSLPLLHLAYGVCLRQKNGKYLQQLSCIAQRVEVSDVFVWLRHCAFRLLLLLGAVCLTEEEAHLGRRRRTRVGVWQVGLR